MNRIQALLSRGDRVSPPDDLGDKIHDAAGRLSRAVAAWFQQTGNRPADCTLSAATSATPTQLTITVTIAKGA